jgi:putative nucleotide binding protein
MYDDYAYIFQIKGSNAFVLGANNLNALEILIRKDASVSIGEKLYIGKEKREKVYSIKRKLASNDMKKADDGEVLSVIETIVIENEDKYIEFVNNSRSLTIKRHQLQLIPNIGEKIFKLVLEEREKEKYKNFKDFNSRTGLAMEKNIAKRIYLELTGEEKISLFALR